MNIKQSKIVKIAVRRNNCLLVAAFMFAVTVFWMGKAFANNTWDGGHPTQGGISYNENWELDTAPTPGLPLIFPDGADYSQQPVIDVEFTAGGMTIDMPALADVVTLSGNNTYTGKTKVSKGGLKLGYAYLPDILRWFAW